MGFEFFRNLLQASVLLSAQSFLNWVAIVYRFFLWVCEFLDFCNIILYNFHWITNQFRAFL